MKPRIVTAANQHEDGTIILGIRHWDSHMHKQVKAMPKYADREDYWIEGFVDQFGTFYNRKEAFILAAKSFGYAAISLLRNFTVNTYTNNQIAFYGNLILSAVTQDLIGKVLFLTIAIISLILMIKAK